MKKIETFLPVFPGFYGSIFEMNEEPEIEYQSEDLKKELNYDDFDYDNKGYMIDVCKKAVNVVEQELKHVLKSLINIEFQAVSSPREYNFENDSINVEITLKDTKEIKKYLYDNKDEYSEYLKRYTSCSGFISYHPDTFDGWKDNTNDFTNLSENGHYLGSILDFICVNEDITDMTLYENIEFCTSEYMTVKENKEQ